MFVQRSGIQSLLKDGGRHYEGSENTILKSITACQNLAEIVRTSFGPNCMNKLIVNHIDKLYVTSDVATILQQLEIQHPAAKIIATASAMQNQEYGDGTTYVVIFAGELLNQAGQLLKQGIHVSDIIKGYEIALNKTLEILKNSVSCSYSMKHPEDGLFLTLGGVLAPKALGYESFFARLLTEAANKIIPENSTTFDVDNIRVVKLLGGSVQQSQLIHGMVLPRDVTSFVKEKTKCKVMVLGCGLELSSTETKGTVLLHTAEELLSFSKGEEDEMEEIIREIVDAGVEAIIVGGSISDLAQHYCNKYQILTLKCQSKFELRRLCKTLGASSLIRLGKPVPEDLGYADSIKMEEIASNRVCVIKTGDSNIATIIVRGATSNTLDELERALGNGIRHIKNLLKDNQCLPGGGACEIDLSAKLQDFASKHSGLEQYAIYRFAIAFEEIPRILANTAGISSTEALAALYTEHKEGDNSFQITNLFTSGHCTTDLEELNRPWYVVDHYKTKECAIKLAVNAALVLLSVDQYFQARPAGGPAPPKQQGNWDDDV